MEQVISSFDSVVTVYKLKLRNIQIYQEKLSCVFLRMIYTTGLVDKVFVIKHLRFTLQYSGSHFGQSVYAAFL